LTAAAGGPAAKKARRAMAGTANVTQINETYLKQLQSQLDTILSDVEGQLRGIGATTDTSTTGYLSAVTSDLSVMAGGGTGTSGTFAAATELNSALSAMGGSVNDQLTWLKQVLTDMITEIGTTIDSFTSTESLNSETVEQLMTDFQDTITDMSNPPGGTSSSSSGSGGSGSS
jgi:hypothetical protein